ncbi:hypothetical protein KKF84_15880 [Myxococcota bacterium]|nr:hypothetical protein [Myxococcota bacterium]
MIYVLVIVMFFLAALVTVVRLRRRKPSLDQTPDTPRSFGWKISWLALPGDDVEVVISALRRSDPRFKTTQFMPCNWKSGFKAIFSSITSNQVFVTPSLRGWVLVVNWSPPGNDFLQACHSVLEPLSEELGKAAVFGSYRGVGAVLWGFAKQGRLLRSFSEADGMTYTNFGDRLPEEEAMKLLSWDELNAMDSTGDDDELFERLADEATVTSLAKAWTIDPTTLESISEPSLGRWGRGK